MDFKDRQGQNLNRKKIKIISQSPTEIIADIERYDTVTEEGNLINAEVFNTFQKEIDQANTNASSALNISSEASNNINDAKDYASEALIKAKNAIADSKKAIDLATETANSLADRGTLVYVGNQVKASINFDADPQTQLNTKLNKNFENLTSKQNLTNDDIFVVQETQTKQNVNVSLSTLTKTIMNTAFPVGAIYMSVNSINPSTLFGGIWEQIQDKFLLCAGSTYLAGSSGGKASHILTTAEMPEHNHTYSKSATSTGSTALTIEQMPRHYHAIKTLSGGYSANCTNFSAGKAKAFGGLENAGDIVSVTHARQSGTQLIDDEGGDSGHQHSIETIDSITSTIGSNSPINIMPPYLAIYVWKRIG